MKLITLSASDRRETNARLMDPDAADVYEEHVNRQLRQRICELAFLFETCAEHLDDPDVHRLMTALSDWKEKASGE